MLLAKAFALSFVLLTGPDGQEVRINPSHVVTVREPRNVEGHFHKDVRCLVHLDDGKFVAVIEPCKVVRELLEGEPD
jgi:hypothetical protein